MKKKDQHLLRRPWRYKMTLLFFKFSRPLILWFYRVSQGLLFIRKFIPCATELILFMKKKAFNDVEGFSGIDSIASGDDMLLMHKISNKYPDKVHYLKSKQAIVASLPMQTWKDFFDQRIRWSSKARFYDDKRIFWVLL